MEFFVRPKWSGQKWSERVQKPSRFVWWSFESCFLNFEANVCHVKMNFMLTSNLQVEVHSWNRSILQSFTGKFKWHFCYKFNHSMICLNRFKTKVALFVTVHNDSIFVKCSNIFYQLFDRILEWVSNWFIPLEMEFSKFELVFEKLVQVSFSSKLKLNYSTDFALSHMNELWTCNRIVLKVKMCGFRHVESGWDKVIVESHETYT